MNKLKFFTNFEKEEAWLNELAANGWVLSKRNCFGKYYFEKSSPNKANYRIDFRQFKNKAAFLEYVQLFSDSGWTHVYGTNSSGSQYFLPASPETNDDIFSDDMSKAGKYHRFSEMWGNLFIIYASLMSILSILAIQGNLDPTAIFHPKDMYLTPGLWDLTGSSFWFAFLFETPFVLLRSLSLYFLVIVTAMFLYYTIRAKIEGKKLRSKSENSQL